MAKTMNSLFAISAIISEAAREPRAFSWLWSIFVPGIILFGSIVATYMLYLHFSKKMKSED
jgi:hypothetical protein